MFPRSLATLLSQKKPRNIARRVCEHGQLGSARHFGSRQERFAAEFLYMIQRCLQIADLGVYRNALVAVVGRAHSAIVASGSTAGIDYSVLHRVVTVDLPPKKFAIKLLEPISFSAHNFEMNNRCPHRWSLPSCAFLD